MTTIRLFEIDLSTGKKLSKEQIVWKGTGGNCPEDPHIYKTDPIGTVDTEELSNANFVGPIIGVFATSDSNCSPPVLFKNFRIDQ